MTGSLSDTDAVRTAARGGDADAPALPAVNAEVRAVMGGAKRIWPPIAGDVGHRAGWVHFAPHSASGHDLVAVLARNRPGTADGCDGSGHAQVHT